MSHGAPITKGNVKAAEISTPDKLTDTKNARSRSGVRACTSGSLTMSRREIGASSSAGIAM